MVISGMIEKINLIMSSVLNHFVTGGTSTFDRLSDGEWVMNRQSLVVSDKGNSLAGAIADIVVYAAILVDFLVQVLVGNGVDAGTLP